METLEHRAYRMPGFLSSRPNWLPTAHSPASECCPPFGSNGEGDTLACGRGVSQFGRRDRHWRVRRPYGFDALLYYMVSYLWFSPKSEANPKIMMLHASILWKFVRKCYRGDNYCMEINRAFLLLRSFCNFLNCRTF